jgi:dTDP-4-dehydrorhamnose reductase
MKVLVVGGEGQLGSTISELSASCGFAEFRVTRMEELDLSSEKNVKNFMSSVDFDYVVNCAAYTAVDKAETERETARTINALAPGWIARYAKEKGAGIIHISTDYVFGGNANTPLAPDMPTAPSSVYGATKLEGEKLVAEANPRHLIIRTSWLYSRYGNNFVKTMLRLAGEREELSVVYDQVGAPTYADDLAGAILKILEVGSHNDKAFR